jgi:hypothetical protein
MRVSWTRGRCLTVLAATVAVLHVAGAANAQYMPYGSQNQAQPQSIGVQQQSYASQTQAQSFAMQQPNPQYTAMSYYGNESVAPEPAPMPAQDNGNQGQSAPMMGQGGCYNGSGCEYNYYNTFDQGCGYGCGCYNTQQRCCGNYCMSGGCGPRWFGGVYGLLMERSDSDCVPLGFVTDTANAPPYFPTDAEIVLENHDAAVGYQGGLELRFGMFCGGRGGSGPVGRPYGSGGASNCDSGCASCGCGPTHAWEAVYWGLFDEDATAFLTDITADATRTHGMIDFRGLQFDPGDGLRDVNVFFDYGPPTTDNSAPYDVEIRQLSVRSTFSAQNVELNLMRLPVYRGGNYNGQGPRCEMTTMIGFRLMRFDDDLSLRSDYERMDDNTLGFLAYNVEADNTLYGAQIGGSGTYRIGYSGRLAVHCGTAVGLYGNHMEVTQWMDSPVGTVVQFANGGAGPFFVERAEDDVSVVGEIRLGASYQCHSNWRLYGGWRLLGISGVTVATDQIPSAYITPGQVGAIDGDGALILHGLQTGLEFTY